jgi:hypothetical protein
LAHPNTATTSHLPGIDNKTATAAKSHLPGTDNKDLVSRADPENEETDNDKENSIPATKSEPVDTLGSASLLLGMAAGVLPATGNLSIESVDDVSGSEDNSTDTDSKNNEVDVFNDPGSLDLKHVSKNEFMGLSTKEIQRMMRK